MAEPNGNGVNYSVKELLAKIEGKIDGVIITIGQKAEKHDLERLANKVAALEAATSNIELDKQKAEQVAEALAAKEKADRSLWDQWRSKIAWGVGLLVAASSLYGSFPH